MQLRYCTHCGSCYVDNNNGTVSAITNAKPVPYITDANGNYLVTSQGNSVVMNGRRYKLVPDDNNTPDIDSCEVHYLSIATVSHAFVEPEQPNIKLANPNAE